MTRRCCFLLSTREKVPQRPGSDEPVPPLPADEGEDDDGPGIWTHVTRVFFSPAERRPRQTLTARLGVAASLRCPSEGAERDGRTELCPPSQRRTRHPAGCGFNPRTHRETRATGGAALNRNSL